jgi:hypothetical protein
MFEVILKATLAWNAATMLAKSKEKTWNRNTSAEYFTNKPIR